MTKLIPSLIQNLLFPISFYYPKRFRTTARFLYPLPLKTPLLKQYFLKGKIEEFNVSILQFVQNINSTESKDELSSMLLNFELLLMEKLDFQLNVHNFYRPFEGFLLDVKTRCAEVSNVETLRSFAMDFLDKILNTDAILLFPPSQIALTAVVYSSSKNKIDLDKYCRLILLSQLNNDQVKQFLTIIKCINKQHKEIPVLNIEEIKRIEAKLLKCYNYENDPRSRTFKEKNSKLLEEEDDE